MLVGDADDAAAQLARQARAQADGRAVRPHRHRVAVPDPAGARVLLGELHLGERTLELQLGRALDGRPGEERPVANEGQPPPRCSGSGVVSTLGGASLAGGSGARSPISPNGMPPNAIAETSAKTAEGYGEISTSKRSASFAIQASSSGAGGMTVRRSRCRRPSRLT